MTFCVNNLVIKCYFKIFITLNCRDTGMHAAISKSMRCFLTTWKQVRDIRSRKPQIVAQKKSFSGAEHCAKLDDKVHVVLFQT